MNCSVAWLNSMLEGEPLSADQIEEALTFAGFPIESHTALDGAGGGGGGDTLLDVEITSNRGDCLSHLGLAREVAAATGRRLVVPGKVAGQDVADRAYVAGALGAAVGLEQRAGEGCRLFTLRLVRGVKVGPSPQWMVRRLAAVGQRSINNVVDCTNYVQYELGSPTHVFDLARVAKGADGKPTIVVRGAGAGEKLGLLDGSTVELKAGEMVVADAERATSLAGVMGGQDSGVSAATLDVLVEVATWEPGLVRKAARRLGLRTDASYRFERNVSARTVHAAAARLVELILETAGGVLEEGVLVAGAVPAATRIEFRPARCRTLLGLGLADDQIERALRAQGLMVTAAGERWVCVVPDQRLDLRIEEDLVEEVARTVGLDKLPVSDRMALRVTSPQNSELAVRELSRVLTGCGFFETVTYSFVTPRAAGVFAEAGGGLVAVSDERRRGEGTLRPSVLPSLLLCRCANHHARSAAAGAVRLFEIASGYGEAATGQQRETRRLAMVMDLPPGYAPGVEPAGSAFGRKQAGVRIMRGVLDQLAVALVGTGGERPGLTVAAAAVPSGAFDAATCAEVRLGGSVIGHMGLVSAAAQGQFELDEAVVMAEVELAALLANFPPRAVVRALPAFPAIDRDLSLIVDEAVSWATIEASIVGLKPERLDGLRFVTTYRGKPLAAGKKSVTVRMTFRDEQRTLRDEELGREMQRVLEGMKAAVGATVREA